MSVFLQFTRLSDLLTHFLKYNFYSCFYKSTKMYRTAPGIHIQRRWFCPPLLFRISASARYVVITSLLEQAPDWLMRREYSPKFRFFNSRVCANHTSNAQNAQFALRHSRHLICANRAAGCLSRLCIDLTCKSYALNASFASGVNAPLLCIHTRRDLHE